MFIVEHVNVYVALIQEGTGSYLLLSMFCYSQSFDWRNIQKIRLHFALSFHGGHPEQLHSQILPVIIEMRHFHSLKKGASPKTNALMIRAT